MRIQAHAANKPLRHGLVKYNETSLGGCNVECIWSHGTQDVVG